MPLTKRETALVCLIVALVAARFVGLEKSPPGFYVDEAALAAHAVCLSAHGYDASGQPWPLLSPVLGGGYGTPGLLYGAAALARVFEPSVGLLRVVPAAVTTLTILAVMALAHIWRGRTWALWSGLAAAVSPWAFQFSRIFWDPPLAPCFLMWGLYFWFTPRFGRIGSAALCGACTSLALYSYPPMRVQAPLVMAAAFLLRFDARRMLAMLTCLIGLSLPLIIKTLSGEIQGRFQMISLLDDAYVRNFGEPTLTLKMELLFWNFWAHFTPRFLLFEGDRNLRHSTQSVGHWSVVDLAGVIMLVVVLLARWQPLRMEIPRHRLIMFCVWGYLCGILPAALTWESTPHALRAIGAWPFLSLLAGLGLAELPQRRWAGIAQATCIGLAVVFSAYFLTDYYRAYPARSRNWFDVVSTRQQIMVGGPRSRGYPDLPGKYFDLVYRGIDRCK